MTPPMHKCPAWGCDKMVHQNNLFCRDHTRMLSPERQAELKGTWQTFSKARTDEEKVKALQEHKLACYRAEDDIRRMIYKRKTVGAA